MNGKPTVRAVSRRDWSGDSLFGTVSTSLSVLHDTQSMTHSRHTGIRMHFMAEQETQRPLLIDAENR